jgi:hypothetical protein
MNDKTIAAMTLALEALEHHGGNLPWNAFVEVRKDLREALAQQRKPLTDKEIQEIGETYTDEVWIDDGWSLQFARAIEAAHGITEPTHT